MMPEQAPIYQTNPDSKPLAAPLSYETLRKASYREIFGNSKSSQKKAMNYINFSMERYNFINNSDHHDQTVYSKFFDRRVDYEKGKPQFKDAKKTFQVFSERYNPVAAKRLNDEDMRKEI
jgi:hypothetical protein